MNANGLLIQFDIREMRLLISLIVAEWAEIPKTNVIDVPPYRIENVEKQNRKIFRNKSKITIFSTGMQRWNEHRLMITNLCSLFMRYTHTQCVTHTDHIKRISSTCVLPMELFIVADVFSYCVSIKRSKKKRLMNIMHEHLNVIWMSFLLNETSPIHISLFCWHILRHWKFVCLLIARRIISRVESIEKKMHIFLVSIVQS